MTKRNIPKFNSEEEEANWWYDHREDTAQWFVEAHERGETTTLAEMLARRSKKTGLSYEGLFRRLREEAQAREEQKKAS